MKNINLTTPGWADYELLDSGNNKKLERFGNYILARPETQAIWEIKKPESWESAQAEFQSKEGKGSWKNKDVPEKWEMSWNDIHFTVRLTSFKHTGIFPEQVVNWEWIAEKMKKMEALRQAQGGEAQGGSRVLNLFGYTGIASIVAAKAGAHVTHVDASKQSNAWAKENAELSGTPTESIRFLLDDALKFVEREVRRGATYDGIILDPPAFGRGAKGEIWHIEDDLPQLLNLLKHCLQKNQVRFFF